LALAMIETPLQAEALLIATVSLTALLAAGFFPATGTAITLTTITMRTEIKHRTAGRKVTHALAKNSGTSNRHRFREGPLSLACQVVRFL
jgi:hypothetical protein